MPQISALLGALAWGVLLVILPAEQQTQALIAWLLLLVEASALLGQAGGLRRAIWLQPFAAATAVAALVLPVGAVAGALALGCLRGRLSCRI